MREPVSLSGIRANDLCGNSGGTPFEESEAEHVTLVQLVEVELSGSQKAACGDPGTSGHSRCPISNNF